MTDLLKFLIQAYDIIIKYKTAIEGNGLAIDKFVIILKGLCPIKLHTFGIARNSKTR